MTEHEVVSREERAAARERLLAREKGHTRVGDELARERREPPWVRLEKQHTFDFGFSRSEAQTRGAVAPMLEAATPPILEHMTRETGTDLVGYLTEAPGFDAFIADGGSICHRYSTTARGLEFLTGYYPILDRAPKGRDEGGSSQTWIRRHDEYSA